MNRSTRRQRRVVVIEDDMQTQDLLRTLLEAEGYRVLSAHYAPTPVDFSQLRPEFVVLDLRLSGADEGWPLLQELKVTPGATRIPVLVCTGDHELVRREGDQLRNLAAAIVLEPFEGDTWSSAVEACQQANTRIQKLGRPQVEYACCGGSEPGASCACPIGGRQLDLCGLAG